MGRGRGKGKKQNIITSHEDPGSDKEEKVPAYRRRGRPTKPLKDDIEEQEAEKIEEDGEDAKDSISHTDVNNRAATENGRKRTRSRHAKENLDSVKEENGGGKKLSINDSTKTVGFRQNESRRKNKPRRAAEAVVECK